MAEDAPWTEERLAQLIRDKVEENDGLEYKAARALGTGNKERDEITKDVSALANANGGVIIYGIKEVKLQKGGPAFPEDFDPVDELAFGRERLDHITSLIQPAIPGLKIETVRLERPAPNAIHIITVPRGVKAHQAYDCVYYRRWNFKSEPIRDYEVREINSRQVHPSVDTKIGLQFSGLREGLLRCMLTNTGEVMALHVSCCISVPIRLGGVVLNFADMGVLNEKVEFLFDAQKGPFHRIRFANVSVGSPLFPSDSMTFEIKFMRSDYVFAYGEASLPEEIGTILEFETFADSMPVRRGRVDVLELDPSVAFHLKVPKRTKNLE